MQSTLLGFSADEIGAIVRGMGEPDFRARQICEWMYKKHAVDFKEMTNLPAKLRDRLAAEYSVGRNPPQHEVESRDGTRKYLYGVGDNRHVEAAVIPDKERRTLCLSTQVGCRRGCRFCFTARTPFAGNLSAAEIINQYSSSPERDAITNIVFMGMGEPLDNIDAVLKALDIFTADYAFAMSPTRLTVSTVGIIPALERYLCETRAHLALSLNSPFAEERARLMPSEKENPIADIVKLLRGHDWTGQRRLTFEYIMFEGVNDSDRHAEALARLLRGLECRVNLIPFNSGEGMSLRPAAPAAIAAFQTALRKSGVRVTIRKSKGADIAAACGQLVARR